MPRANFPILVLAIVWAVLSTSYFGWNALPASTPELFADGLFLVFLTAAFALPGEPRVRQRTERRRKTDHAPSVQEAPEPLEAAPAAVGGIDTEARFTARQAKWHEASRLLEELGEPGMAESARGFATIEAQVHKGRQSSVVPFTPASRIDKTGRE